MQKDVDILNIDVEIKNKFKEEVNKISQYKLKLQEIREAIKLENIREQMIQSLIENEKELDEYIHNIENNIYLNFYITESIVLLEKYKEILNTPIKINFLGKMNGNNKQKLEIINEYLDVSKKYIDKLKNTKKLDYIFKTSKTSDKIKKKDKDKITCKNCKNNNDFNILDNNIYICMICYTQQTIIKNISSYRDTERVNISNKYMYDRSTHFKDCINQYQGKQNSTILKNVYDDLENQFRLHHLLIDSKDPKIKFSNITKDHVQIFLKELDYTKHYENINLIHYNLTGKKPDDIGYLENVLLSDFDTLTEIYDKEFKNIDRKNFINTQYVLYQLLCRHKHPCKKEDFSILKTIDRKNFHEDICKILFTQLGWNYVSMF
jgi:hypothetical protein